MTDVVAAGLPTRRVYVSHLTDTELGSLRQSYPDYEFRPRIGTQLWLGDRDALRVRATVLDVHPVERGDVYGYRSRTAPAAGTILVVSGGTAHGIGLEAPTGGATLKDRAARIARGGLEPADGVHDVGSKTARVSNGRHGREHHAPSPSKRRRRPGPPRGTCRRRRCRRPSQAARSASRSSAEAVAVALEHRHDPGVRVADLLAGGRASAPRRRTGSAASGRHRRLM